MHRSPWLSAEPLERPDPRFLSRERGAQSLDGRVRIDPNAELIEPRGQPLVDQRDGHLGSLVYEPLLSCTGCHDGPLSLAHMDQNGGSVGMPRIDDQVEARVETCKLCHGPGRIADVELVHPLLR